MVAIMVACLNYTTSEHDTITQPVVQEMAAFVEAL